MKLDKNVRGFLILFILLLAMAIGVYLTQKPKKELPTEAIRVEDFQIETGRIEKVFNWGGDKCENEDIPDAPARAFVDDEGNVQLIASHKKTRRRIGPNLDEVRHSCDVIFNSDHDSNPRKYNDREWLTAPYTLDGRNIYALIHTEYQGWEHDNCHSSNLMNCWWNSINLASSTNSGRSYSHSRPPSHNILNSPIDYNPDNTQGPIGFFQPTKIVSKDGFYYVLITQHTPDWGHCLMRTNNLADPQSWRLWDGSGFNAPVGQTRCQNLSPSPPGYDLSYNTYLGKYISLCCHWGSACYYSLSDDLIHWGEWVNLFPEAPRPHPEYCMFSSLIQPGDPTRNFEQTGRSPWLYYLNCGDGKCSPGCGHTGLDRDLKRVRIRFTKPGDENRYELLDLQMNEKKGSKTLDSSFYNNNGNLIGNVSFAQEGEKNFLRFSRDGKVEIRHSDSLNVSGQFTIQAKIRVSSAIPAGSFPTIIRKEEASRRNYGLYLNDQGVLHFSFTNNNGPTGSLGTKRINDGQWHQVTVLYDVKTGMARYYVDDQLDVERYHGGRPENGINSSPVIIGDQNFAGDIDSVTLYNYATITLPLTPTPTPSPTSIPSPTPTPTPSPTPLPTPSPTATPSPTSTPVPIFTPTPTSSPIPQTPTPTSIPSPTPTPEPGKAHLTFKIKFQGISSQKPTKSVSIILKQEGQEKYKFENIGIDSDQSGIYTGKMMNITAGAYNFFIKGWAHLQKKFEGVTFVEGENTKDWSTAVLLAGDAVENNKIDIFDYNKIVEHFGSRMPAGGSPADFDLDGDVDIFDYNFLVANFGKTGD